MMESVPLKKGRKANDLLLSLSLSLSLSVFVSLGHVRTPYEIQAGNQSSLTQGMHWHLQHPFGQTQYSQGTQSRAERERF